MGKLTSRERLRRCFWHEELDRPAVYVRWGGMETNTDPTYAEMKRLVLEKTDLKIPWDASALVELLGSERFALMSVDERDLVHRLIGRECEIDDREGLIVCPTASPYRVGDGLLCRPNYEAMIREVLSVGGHDE
jgi:hypothetical protein